MHDAGDTAVRLAHRIALAYLRHGQPHRAIVLLITATHAAQTRTDILVSLAASMISVRLGEQAMSVFERIEMLDPQLAQSPLVRRLYARAQMALGQNEQAARTIQDAIR